MLLSLNWLREFVPYEGDAASLAERLTMLGLEVEEIANTLGINERTARRDWVAAREWLRDRLEPPA